MDEDHASIVSVVPLNVTTPSISTNIEMNSLRSLAVIRSRRVVIRVKMVQSESRLCQATSEPATNFIILLSRRLDSLGELVASMQGQLNALVAHMKMSGEMFSSDTTRRPRDVGVQRGLPSSEPPAMIGFSNNSTLSPTTDSGSNSRPSRRAMNVFCGPTSPEYSLNAAQRKMQYEAMSGVKPGQTIAPSIDDEQFDDEQDQQCSQASESPMYIQRPSEQTYQAALLRFRNMIPISEAVRLLRVYHNVIGELHPICDIEHLIKQTETYYKRSNSETSILASPNIPIDEDDLLMVNLAITIALSAESGTSLDAGKTIYDNCSEIIKSKLASPAADTKHVAIVLLVVSIATALHHWSYAMILIIMCTYRAFITSSRLRSVSPGACVDLQAAWPWS